MNRRTRIASILTPAEWRSLIGMAVVIVALHVVGWGVLAGIVAPHSFDIGSGQVFGIGLGLTAYALGMRHAFDADHIAAIDNTSRKLMSDHQRPLSVGFWFSLGHSSIVFVLVALLALGVRALAGQISSESSALQHVTNLVGTAVSGTFLYLIGIVNLVILIGIVKAFRRMRYERLGDDALEAQLANRGLLSRLLGGAMRTVRRPWHMYPIGLAFGFGFDTATEVSLLVLAGGAAAFSLPWYAVLTLPILFAAGMSLLDTIDGCFMNVAYGWALTTPVRKIFYNLTVTGLSVAVALIIGTIQLTSILADRLGVTHGPLAYLAKLDLSAVGLVVALGFVGVWVLALAVWRFGRIEQRWTPTAPAD
ncbi:MAG TPA: HoxN/HupN/NixA family nickel/cobalt transporter [Propionibacteriaceae bacterium]|nr:HoxN/HupN/NixA family nickel/cobalt transporter [Propionibacteriaceae bacterium]